MKITKKQLKQIIKEELETVIDEGIFGNLFGAEKTAGEIKHEKDQEKKAEMLADMIKWTRFLVLLLAGQKCRINGVGSMKFLSCSNKDFKF